MPSGHQERLIDHRPPARVFTVRLATVLLSITLLAGAGRRPQAPPAQPSPAAAQEPPLLNVKDLAPGILLDLRYATPNNFTGHTLYPAAECLLCEPAARRLARVQSKLEKRGLGLKVWDCYRPISVQKKLWQIVPDPRYVADPKTGSRHNRGASVDLTLVDKSGNELTMPTPFDDFTEKAHRDYSQLPPEAIKNRKILQDAMEDEGFMGLPTEWWHFDDPEWSHFALRDEPLGSPSLRVEKTVKLSAGASTAAIGGEVKQLVVVRTSGWSEKGGTLQRFERSGEGWKRVGEPWPVSVGGKGLAWGRGLQPAEDGPMKQEGDLTAPAGIFPIGKSYGYADAAPAGSRWPYGRLGETSLCVDDPKSKHYNEIFDATPGVAKDWSSAETMRRKDHLYKWLLNVEQNTPVQCGCGSCIFLHIWRTPGATTEGCTAMEEENLLTLIRWLDPAGRAMLVQLPDEAYGKCRDAWGLP